MSKTFVYPDGHKQPITFDSGSSTSDPFEVRNGRGFSLDLPTAWTAADIGFDVSDDGILWRPIENAVGTRAKLTNIPTTDATTPGSRQCPADLWGGGAYPLMRLHSLDTTDESDENQAVARTLMVRFYI